MIKRSTKTVIIFLWMLIVSIKVLGLSVTSDQAYSRNFPFVYVVEDGQSMPQITDEQFFDHAATVVFPVGVSRLPNNSSVLEEIEKSVLPRLNADSLQLVRIIFRGAASPEGPVELNRQLGRQRVKNLCQWVFDRLQFPVADSLFSIDAEIEDYPSLCLMMRRSGDPDYALVQHLCDTWLANDVSQLKSQLQRAQQGRLWTRLLSTYFPSLRTARFVMVLRKYVPPVPVQAVESVALPETQSVATFNDTVEFVPDTIAAAPLPDWEPRREVLALKTNLLFYGVYLPGYNRWCPIPNVAIEYYPRRGHFTFGASFDMPWWQDYDAHKFFQLRNYQLETRYYLRSGSLDKNTPGEGPAFRGLYVQAYGHLGLYGICFDANRGWVGEGFGAGLGVGYVVPLTKKGHWRLEFQLQAGFFRTKYDPYKYENPINPDYHDDLYYYKWTLEPSLFKKRQYRWNWLGPTRIGVTLSYDLLYRKNHKWGISLKNKERRDGYEK